ncbi:ATP-binding protein [Glaciihabitans arcticus]|uniref:ATP-binding protein n=1 Tax=Glaciihabitans arcticus TaxID=2668039 RepID=A0A4Q9H015_9MICO|nr:AAA family ATPase [Glaciihabitans arcticus]TBN58010.1 ATP-binding protein [Glaciihabitans arcticus]
MLTTVAVEGYRSLRSLVLPLGPFTVVTGANGSGKSSLYRSLRLLAAASRDGAIAALAAEGGLSSTMWAGPENGTRAGFPTQGTTRSGPVALKLGFASDDLSYAIDFGLPQPSRTAFSLDPEIKTENIWSGQILRPGTLLTERHGPSVRVRTGDDWLRHELKLAPWSSVLSEVGDARAAPEVLALRETLRSWRFYDSLRTDADAEARQAHIGTRTPVLSASGSDLAAALQTIREIGVAAELDAAVDRAFPGSRVGVDAPDGRFAVSLTQPGLLRPLGAAELSDGTLRYLLWIAALLSPRPAPLLVLNEPETSLHPALLEPLGELIAAASKNSQLIVVSHSAPLIAALGRAGALVHELSKENGETRLVGQGLLDAPRWSWPSR